MKSVMNHSFSTVPSPDVKRSTFNRSSGHKSTFDFGNLIPFYADEALPGDTFNLKSTLFARLATPVFPIMDNMSIDTQFFSVPLRLLWTKFPRFMGEQLDPDLTTDFILPIMDSAAGYAVMSLHDYLGIPPGVANVEHQSLFHRAYNLIWNTWYRSEDLQDRVTVDLGDGPDLPANYVLLRRNKRHDYFTSCLPWPQKSEFGAVSIPLGTEAPIFGDGMDFDGIEDTANKAQVLNAPGGVLKQLVADGTNVYGSAAADGIGQLKTDLTNATAATINQLRQSFQIQKMFERDARGGTRYTSVIRAHFGITSPDARQQRPEYLGGGSSAINISTVPQTSSTDVVTPQGNLAAYGTVGASNHGFLHSFTEHCIVLGIVSAKADLSYSQGVPRMFNRSTKHDFYWPALAHLGEQAVLNKEIFVQGIGADDAVFGYQEIWSEYRYKNSTISGLFRPDAAGTLAAWHLSQDFGALPLLDDAFITEDPPIDRVIAVPAEPHLLFDSYTSLQCTRPMPMRSTPGLIDHF